MVRVGLVLLGLVLFGSVTFANPLQGNVLGFCPLSEGPKAFAVDGIVAAIDAVAIWLAYRGFRG